MIPVRIYYITLQEAATRRNAYRGMPLDYSRPRRCQDHPTIKLERGERERSMLLMIVTSGALV